PPQLPARLDTASPTTNHSEFPPAPRSAHDHATMTVSHRLLPASSAHLCAPARFSAATPVPSCLAGAVPSPCWPPPVSLLARATPCSHLPLHHARPIWSHLTGVSLAVAMPLLWPPAMRRPSRPVPPHAGGPNLPAFHAAPSPTTVLFYLDPHRSRPSAVIWRPAATALHAHLVALAPRRSLSPEAAYERSGSMIPELSGFARYAWPISPLPVPPLPPAARVPDPIATLPTHSSFPSPRAASSLNDRSSISTLPRPRCSEQQRQQGVRTSLMTRLPAAARACAAASRTSLSTLTRTTPASVPSLNALSSSSTPMSRSRRTATRATGLTENHDNNGSSTKEVAPVSPAVATPSLPQLHDTAACLKRVRSESMSASVSYQQPLPCSYFAFGIDAPPASPSSASSASGSAPMSHPLPASPNFPSPLAPLPRPPLAPTCLLSTIPCAAFPHLRAPQVIPVQLPLHPLHGHIAHPCAGDYAHTPPLSPSAPHVTLCIRGPLRRWHL
ncbi:hypothetical protein B0H14DRAFT_3584896, partial [Mycena olivaceomarginata]